MPKFLKMIMPIVCLCALALPALPQHEGHEGSMVGSVPREILERPLTLRHGIGIVHEKVTTSSVQAQSFYDQGLAYLHSFVWIEAARSFNQALRLDPRLAMAEVGLSDAFMGLSDAEAARAALEKAQSLADGVSDSERRKIQIQVLLLAWFADSGDLQKYFAYRKGITDAIAAAPQDPWLWIQRAFADEGSPHAHGQNGAADTIAFYETALGFAPDDFPAHHYLAHTFETLGRSEDALAQSEIYLRMAPAIPHAHHMRGHDLRRLGRTEEALADFQRADQLEEDYYRSEKMPGQYDWHHVHNLNLLAMCHETLGQMKLAEKLLQEAFALPVYNDLAEFNRRAWPEFLLSRGRYDEALAAAQQLSDGQGAMARFAGHTVAGRALLRLNRVSEAQTELSLAEQELGRLPVSVAAALPDAGLLHAELLLYQGRTDASDRLFHEIIQTVRSVPGPDSWSEALFQLESIAAMARETDHWDLTEFAARQMIEHDPTYAGGHYFLALTADHNGDARTSLEQFTLAKKLWGKADAEMAELVYALQRLAAVHN